ncbi:PucR family transcriptional regulator [Streptomyces sannanensis]|uniref:PucR family transcriptional regulator n=1 Tax=Streptomyces sannanensis TaxID=285536 RepID=A0ABP6SA42_9ACTN
MPDPPAPPTPPISLAALLAREDLGLRRIAGPDEDRPVHWVHTSEMADPYPYLLGGELLLTAGVQLTDPDAYVARVVGAGAAALGFGVAPVYDTVPPALVKACDRHGLPLLEVPQRTPFTTVARAVWRLMAEARHQELRRVTQAQQALATAAARPDPIPAVLRALAARLNGWAVLHGPDGTDLDATGRAPSDGVRAALARLTRVVSPQPPDGDRPARPAPTSATDTVEDTRLAAYALGGGEGFTLGVATAGREAGDNTIAGIAVLLLSLLTARLQGKGSTGHDSALVRLLLGASPAEAAPLVGEGPWTVVHARGTGTPAALGAALGSSLADTDGDTVRVLLPGAREVTAHPGWTLGVSAPADPADLPAADAQAARALHRAEAARTPLFRHRDAGMASLVDPAEARAHARTLLAPIADSPALTGTLRTWLSLHGSWDRTASALGVHRNTVRQRIARCAALLDTDLDDPDVRMELWFALRKA